MQFSEVVEKYVFQDDKTLFLKQVGASFPDHLKLADRVLDVPCDTKSLVSFATGMGLYGYNPVLVLKQEQVLEGAFVDLYQSGAQLRYQLGSQFQSPIRFLILYTRPLYVESLFSQLPALRVYSVTDGEMLGVTLEELKKEPDPSVVLIPESVCDYEELIRESSTSEVPVDLTDSKDKLLVSPTENSADKEAVLSEEGSSIDDERVVEKRTSTEIAESSIQSEFREEFAQKSDVQSGQKFTAISVANESCHVSENSDIEATQKTVDPDSIALEEADSLELQSNDVVETKTKLAVYRNFTKHSEGSDLTILTYGLITETVKKAVDRMGDCSAEIIELHTITPLDISEVLASVKKTGRLAIIHDAPKQFGLGSEVAAWIVEEAVDSLLAPIRRLGGPAIPSLRSMLKQNLISEQDIVDLLEDLKRFT